MRHFTYALLSLMLSIFLTPPIWASRVSDGSGTAASTADASSNTTDVSGYYVIQNVETGEYMTYIQDKSAPSRECASFVATMPTAEADIQKALWKIDKPADGQCTFYNVGKGAYLTYAIGDKWLSATYKGYYATCYSSTPYTFYYFTNPYNMAGYAVSAKDQTVTDNLNKYCWYAFHKNSQMWLCSTEGTALTTAKLHDGVNFYQLPTFRFLSYSDLVSEAKALGVTGYASTPTTVSDYATLVNLIVTAAGTDIPFVTQLMDHTDHLLIRNQRFGTYLAMRPNGSLYASNAITSDCVWTPQEADADKGQYNFVCFGSGKDLTINGQRVLNLYHSAEPDAVTAKGSDNMEYPSGYFRMAGVSGTGTSSTTLYLSASPDRTVASSSAYAVSKLSERTDGKFLLGYDWSLEPYDLNENIENTAVRETSIQDNLFFRLQNEGFSLGLGAGTAGWLNDADHVDMRAVDYYLSDKTPDVDNAGNKELISAFSVRPKVLDGHTAKGKASANSLWRFIRVAKMGEDMPIGVIGTHGHDIYLIQNANSGDYLKLPGSDSKYNYMTETTDRSKADKFWLEELTDGQYAIAVRDPNVTASDSRKGYLAISNDIYRAALILSTETTKPAANTTRGWSILQAVSVAAMTATASQQGDIEAAKTLGYDVTGTDPCKGFRYVTAYYPFDITPVDKDVRMFKAVKGDGTYVAFREVHTTVPANHGVLCIIPYRAGDENTNIEFSISQPTAAGPEFSDNVLTGVTQSEKATGYVFADLTGDELTAARQSIYVLSTLEQDASTGTNKTVALGLLHPLDNWLMANRCYVEASRVTDTTVGNVKSMRLSFDTGDITGITTVPTRRHDDGAWYDLMGRRVTTPVKGIYIHNGHKIVID